MNEGTSITIELHGHIELHESLYVSSCDELPLIGTGMTSEDAMGSFLMCLKEYIRLSCEWGIAEETVVNWNQNTTMSPGKFTLSLPRITGGQWASAAV